MYIVTVTSLLKKAISSICWSQCEPYMTSEICSKLTYFVTESKRFPNRLLPKDFRKANLREFVVKSFHMTCKSGLLANKSYNRRYKKDLNYKVSATMIKSSFPNARFIHIYQPLPSGRI